MTVLFAEVRGSMALAEQLDAEAWSDIMQRLFRILTEGVERFVDKFTGDGIMARRGADRPRGPRRACLLHGAPAPRRAQPSTHAR